MTEIRFKIKDKKLFSPKKYLISSNCDYVFVFDFDEAFSAVQAKTLRIIYDGNYYDIIFTGNRAEVSNIPACARLCIGVFTDTLATEIYEIGCCLSVKDAGGTAVTEFAKSQYDQIVALLNETDLRQISGISRDGDTLVISYNNSTADTVPLKDGTCATVKVGKVTSVKTPEQASVVNVGTQTEAVLDFCLAQGEVGPAGKTPEFSIGTVETVAPEEPASATLSGTAEKPVLNLKIPHGKTGSFEGIEISTSRTVAVGKDKAVTLDEEIQSQEVQLQWKIPGVKVVPPFTNYFLEKSNISYPRELYGGYNQFWSSSSGHGNADAFVSGHNYFWAFKYEMDGDSTVQVYNSSASNTQTPNGSMTLTGTGWVYQLKGYLSAESSYCLLNNLSGTGRVIYTYCIDITALQETYSDVPSKLSELAELFGELPLVPGQNFAGATTGGADNVFLNVTRGEDSFRVSCLEASAVLQGGDVLQTTDGSAVFGVVLKKVFAQERRFVGKKWVAFGDSTTDPSINATKKYCDYIVEETGITLVNMGMGGTGYWRTNENGTAFYQRAKQIPADADVITCFGSINDWKYVNSGLEIGAASDTLESGTICGYINEFINVCHEVAPYAQIALISMQPNRGIGTYIMENLNNALKSVAAYRKIKFLDLWNESGLRTDDSVKAYYFTDPDSEVMCHPSNEGHRLIYPDILQLLNRMVGGV